jgi:paraquat-inducible protein B
MNDLQNHPEIAEELAEAKVKRTSWNFPIVWVVPVAAAIVAGYLVYQHVQAFGPKITIKFRDASGLKAGQTPIKYRGVPIGQVTAIELSKDQQYALVTAHLQSAAESTAREGSVFWIVRPQVGIANITGLGTVITGPHVEMSPGAGDAKSEFIGLENSPIIAEFSGLKIILRASRLGTLKAGSPVYYRGVAVGAVDDIQLSADAASVDVHVYVKRRFAKLVRSGSRFWHVSGLDLNFGLFRGLEIKVESLESLAAGGVAFATPDDPKDTAAKNGMIFPLRDRPEKEWSEWRPKFPIPPEK